MEGCQTTEKNNSQHGGGTMIPAMSYIAYFLVTLAVSAAMPSLAAEGPALSSPAPGVARLPTGREVALPMSKDDLFALDADETPPAKTKPEPAKADLPANLNELFETGPQEQRAPPATAVTAPPPASREALFPDVMPAKSVEKEEGLVFNGFARGELAYTHGKPEHWSKTMARLQVGTQGRSEGFKWKASLRLGYNPVYSLTDHYPKAVRDDQGTEAEIRETYIDFTSGGWDWRIGRQHIVWGEMVGLFFADVVSAKDLREFILPDFDTIRIPQWAARAEYFGSDFHAELIWIPFPSYDRIGKPGADFYPYPPTPPGVPVVFAAEARPGNSPGNTNYGARISTLVDGWDLSAFYYRSTDAAATFYRTIQAGPTYLYQPRHERIWQVGGTLGKDLASFVLKAEMIYTDGRKYNVVDVTDPDGVVTQDTVDWVLGFDFDSGSNTRFNGQLFQRIYLDHDPDIIPDEHENGLSLLLNRKLGRGWEAELLLIASLNRTDWLLQPKLTWRLTSDWTLDLGADVFHGRSTGLLGRFSNPDRVWAEVRYDF